MSIADQNWHFGPTDPPLYGIEAEMPDHKLARLADLLARVSAVVNSPRTPGQILEDLRVMLRRAGL